MKQYVKKKARLILIWSVHTHMVVDPRVVQILIRSENTKYNKKIVLHRQY